jgi:hypothetical protein
VLVVSSEAEEPLFDGGEVGEVVVSFDQTTGDFVKDNVSPVAIPIADLPRNSPPTPTSKATSARAAIRPT